MREDTNPGLRAIVALGDEETPPGKRRRKSDSGWWANAPLPVKALVYLAAGGTIPAGVWAMLPFETRDEAKIVHAAEVEERKKADAHLQAQLDALKVELPAAVVKAINDDAARRRRR